MAPAIATREPAGFMAGDTVKWTKALPDFSPADGSVLSYAITGPSLVAAGGITITPNAADWSVVLAATATDLLLAGTYTWTAFVTLAGERSQVDAGVFVIERNAATVTTAEVSHAAQMLAALESEIQARITGTGGAHDSYAINGRSIAKMKVSELTVLRDQYAREVWRERNPAAASPSRVVVFR